MSGLAENHFYRDIVRWRRSSDALHSAARRDPITALLRKTAEASGVDKKCAAALPRPGRLVSVLQPQKLGPGWI